ncbi:hypothetical protein IQ07DRAFT_373934 [Pyrenochaeta sp. DS3sAY3a]|nr:hypothetical protein IQ07DRAFT_373934 [Pyrenochaeta sp. DS3sAY3a]
MPSYLRKLFKKKHPSRITDVNAVEPMNDRSAGTNKTIQSDLERVNSAPYGDFWDAELFKHDSASWFAKAALQYNIAMALRLAGIDPHTLNLMDTLDRIETEYSGKPCQYSPDGSAVLNPGMKMLDRLKGAWVTGDVKVEKLTGFMEQLTGAIHKAFTVPHSDGLSELGGDIPPQGPTSVNGGTVPETVADTTIANLTPQAQATTPIVECQNDIPQPLDPSTPSNPPATPDFAIPSDPLPRGGGISLDTRTNMDSSDTDGDTSTGNSSPTTTASLDSFPPSPVVGSIKDLSKYMVILNLHAQKLGRPLKDIDDGRIPNSNQYHYEGTFEGVSAVGVGRSSKIAKYLAVKKMCEELDLVRGL